MRGTRRPPHLHAVLAVLALLAGSAPAAMVTRRWGTPPRSAPVKARRAAPPTGYVAQARSAPKLDGDLGDACWAAAHPLVLASTLDGGGRASQPTEVRLLHDAEMLYAAIRCAEPFVSKLKGSRRGHDGEFWNDDSLEIFIGPAGGGYFHFGITAFGSTYDGAAKNASWNSGMQAAAARGKADWTLEAAIPLAKLAPQGKTPERWMANFTRNRYTGGRWEELAWSPTYSGNSHVPGRFGTLLFRDPPPTARQPKEARRVTPEVEILPADGAEGIVRFDLADLKGKTIHRADLLVFRTAKITGANDEAMVDIEILPLVGTQRGERLEPRPPWFDRLDATAAVRAWAAGKPNGGFLVKTLPLWRSDSTCLEVAFEGEPKDVPPAAKAPQAAHRDGQTFITWTEIADLAGSDQPSWGALKTVLGNMDRDREVRYCIYRGTRPITAATLHQAELLARVKPLSGWNLNGRNIDRPIDHVIATQEVLFCHHWSPFRNASVDGEYGRDCPVDRLVIEDGKPPPPRGTGLYVHTPTAKGQAWYAVVTRIDGVENTRDVACTGPVAETPGEPQPVLQGVLPRMPFFNYAEKRLHYVRWVAPPLVNVPSQYYNWSVGVPEKLGRGVPLELSLHRDGHSYWRTQYRIERDSVVLSPHDFPFTTWWHGYHESCGTLRSFRQGAIQPYTERRLLSFVDWACGKWPVDRHRVLVTGCRGGAAGSGALHLGIGHPGIFNLVIAGHPMVDYAEASRRTDRHGLAPALSMQAIWGKADWDLKTPDGQSFWAQHDLNRAVRERASLDGLPFITMSSNHGHATCRAFYEALLRRHAGIMAEFSWGGARYIPVSNSGTYPNVIRLDIRRNASFLAFCTPEALARVTEGKMGDFNRHFRWRDVVDVPGRFEATLFTQGRGEAVADMVPRRLQKLELAKGRAFVWKHGGQSGEATVGHDGVLVIPALKLTPEGSRLVVTPR